jgi:hypothetical protein
MLAEGERPRHLTIGPAADPPEGTRRQFLSGCCPCGRLLMVGTAPAGH